MGVNNWAVLAATVAMFMVGSAWYMGIFAKMWGEMFGFDKLSKKEQKVMQAKMGPWMLLQLVVTAISAAGLAKMISLLPNYSVYTLAGMLWIGFIVPVTVSGVIFGGTEPKWIKRKILIQIGESLTHLMVAAWAIGLIQK